MKTVYFVIIGLCAIALAASLAFFEQTEIYERAIEKTIRNINIPGTSMASDHLHSASQHSLILMADDTSFTAPPELIASWLDEYYRPFTKRNEYRVDFDAVRTYLQQIAPRLAINPVNAHFDIQDGHIIEKTPSVQGQTLNIDESLTSVTKALLHDAGSVQLVVDTKEAKLTAQSLADMGITTMISEGTSTYTGSSAARVTNIKVALKKLDGIIVQPGEEFSFNNAIGEISGATGYVPGLVIKGTKLVPEYGGGVCQVSTTMFRAAVLAGLPITERHAHGLPVSFYNPQGFDSTIYTGVTDLKFVNDTAAPILIQSQTVHNMALFEIFGALPQRTVTIDGPHQYDVKPDGSLKAVLTRTISYADNTKKTESWYSAYQSPGLFETIRNPLE